MGEVRGSGLLLGIVFTSPIAKKIAAELLSKHILVNTPDEFVIRVAPAYVVTDEQIKEFINALREVLAK